MSMMTRAGLTRPLAVLLVSVVAAALIGEPAAQAPVRQAIDVTKLGPQVGQTIPDFSLKDQAGRTWTRQSIMGPRGAMLVFFRSADW
jgi:hypothetical protein